MVAVRRSERTPDLADDDPIKEFLDDSAGPVTGKHLVTVDVATARS